jgi:hypothetical protein
MFEIKAKISFDPINVTKKHSKQSEWKKVALVELKDDTFALYSWFLEKEHGIKLNKPLRGSHFTVINDIVDDNIYLQAKDLFGGKEITLFIDPTNVRANSKGHWWIKVYSDDAQNIRNVMGLGDPYFGFHLTIGLATHDELEKSEIVRITNTKGYKEGSKLYIERLIRKGVLKWKDDKFI